ncbi:hypothetical protein KAR91_53725 [Candidatus Pacearchaeota archaeon]|nr:hypothetical protein [Candidatus Pacearchaeota archaeon]
MNNEPRCCAPTLSNSYTYTPTCSRRGVVEREGKHYCKQHDPEAIKERRRIRYEKWEKKKENQNKRWELSRLLEKKRDVAELLYDNLKIFQAKGLLSPDILELITKVETEASGKGEG